MAARVTLYDLLLMERGTEVSNDELSFGSLARRLLFRGETVMPGDFAHKYDTSPSAVHMAAKTFEALGFQVEKIVGPPGGHGRPPVAFRLVDPDRPIDRGAAARISKTRTQKRQQYERSTSAPTKIKAATEVEVASSPPVAASRDDDHALDLPPLPGIDQHLRVYAIARDLNDGTFTVGVANGSRTWLMKVVGTAAR